MIIIVNKVSFWIFHVQITHILKQLIDNIIMIYTDSDIVALMDDSRISSHIDKISFLLIFYLCETCWVSLLFCPYDILIHQFKI